MVKILTLLFFGTYWPKSLKLGIQNQALNVLQYYQVGLADVPKFAFDRFMQRSALDHYSFVWQTA